MVKYFEAGKWFIEFSYNPDAWVLGFTFGYWYGLNLEIRIGPLNVSCGTFIDGEE